MSRVLPLVLLLACAEATLPEPPSPLVTATLTDSFTPAEVTGAYVRGSVFEVSAIGVRAAHVRVESSDPSVLHLGAPSRTAAEIATITHAAEARAVGDAELRLYVDDQLVEVAPVHVGHPTHAIYRALIADGWFGAERERVVAPRLLEGGSVAIVPHWYEGERELRGRRVLEAHGATVLRRHRRDAFVLAGTGSGAHQVTLRADGAEQTFRYEVVSSPARVTIHEHRDALDGAVQWLVVRAFDEQHRPLLGAGDLARWRFDGAVSGSDAGTAFYFTQDRSRRAIAHVEVAGITASRAFHPGSELHADPLVY